MRSCEFCGSEIPEYSSFCGVCGQAVGDARQTARGNDGYAIPGESIPGSTRNVNAPNSQRRSTRKPYQFSPQPYQSQQ